MTIVLPSQAHPDNECGHAAESFFSGADIEEFQRAMSEWQVPACTLVVDVPTAGESQKGKAGHAAVWLLSSTTPEVRAYLGEDGDSLLPQAHKERDSFDAPGAADIQLESYFAMASCSKPITAYALHLALERAGMTWQTPVRDVLPEFRLAQLPHASTNAADQRGCAGVTDVKGQTGEMRDASALCTFEDLVSHRSGIGGWHVVHGPQLPGRDVVQVLAHLPAAHPFRQRYNYASLPFHLAAHAIEQLDKLVHVNSPVHGSAASPCQAPRGGGGRSFIDFVEQEILHPLGMTGGYIRSNLPKRLVIPGHVQFSGSKGFGEAEGVVNRLEDGDSFGSGGVLMNARDLAKWLRAAPRLSGLPEMADERIKDDMHGWLEWRDNGMQSGLSLRTFRNRGVRIVNMAGTTPDFATMTAWFPAATQADDDRSGAWEFEVAVGMMANAGTGGCYLRALIRCRAAEKVGRLPHRDWFTIIGKIRQADLGPAAWMHPSPGLPITPSHTLALSGRWTHPSFPDLVIAPDDIVSQLPDLEMIPYLPFLYGFTRCIFCPSQEAGSTVVSASQEGVGGVKIKFAACFEVKVDGRAHCGLPFTATVDVEKGTMVIKGWADEGAAGPVVVFEKQ